MNLKISDIPRYGSVRSTKHKIKAELLKAIRVHERGVTSRVSQESTSNYFCLLAGIEFCSSPPAYKVKRINKTRPIFAHLRAAQEK